MHLDGCMCVYIWLANCAEKTTQLSNLFFGQTFSPQNFKLAEPTALNIDLSEHSSIKSSDMIVLNMYFVVIKKHTYKFGSLQCFQFIFVCFLFGKTCR